VTRPKSAAALIASPDPPGRTQALWRSTVGKKAVMAASGLVMILFLLFHLAANLNVFIGPAALNGLAGVLDSLGPLLWVARLVLLISVLVHIGAAAGLWALAASARPTRYVKQVPQASTVASRSMRWTGILLLAFIVFHVLHLGTGTIHPVPYHPADIYASVTGGLRMGWVAAIYIVGMMALGLHLYHGCWSYPRSLGLASPKPAPMRRPLATIVAVVLWLGFTAIPLAALSGAIR
jgi:succinate dehydrogenase / fumarate reductase cytochrome b subunit